MITEENLDTDTRELHYVRWVDVDIFIEFEPIFFLNFLIIITLQ